MWPQHGRSDKHMVDRFTKKLNRKQSRRFFGIISPITTHSHIVDTFATVLRPPAPPSSMVRWRESRDCVPVLRKPFAVRNHTHFPFRGDKPR